MFHPKGPGFWELARQALSSTERGYDLLAPKFDYTPFRTPDEILEAAISRIDAPVDSALDLCCGTGAAMAFLYPKCRERLVGIDMSQGMLDQARANVASWEGDLSVELVRGNVLDMHFGKSFDLATCFGALGHILDKDQDLFLEQIKGVLKPGGRFLFVTGGHPPFLSAEFFFSKSFNLAMHIRNLLFPKRFEMFYMTFLLPEIKEKLEAHGFHVTLSQGKSSHPAALRVVIATLPEEI